jgi:hypothetical protein
VSLFPQSATTRRVLARSGGIRLRFEAIVDPPP